VAVLNGFGKIGGFFKLNIPGPKKYEPNTLFSTWNKMLREEKKLV